MCGLILPACESNRPQCVPAREGEEGGGGVGRSGKAI
jgi:hypothetical protein